MSKKPLNISEEAAVQMPMKTVASLIIIVALGTMGYFQILERLNIADTRIQIMEKDLNENTEFRIKWPRGHFILNSVFSPRSFSIICILVSAILRRSKI